jgi:hypothetical protein
MSLQVKDIRTDLFCALLSARPGLPLEAANAETVIYGSEVPKPTITIPTNSGGMSNKRAVATGTLDETVVTPARRYQAFYNRMKC